MRGTLIVYADPRTLDLLAREGRRFHGHRTGFRDRLYAAWLVFTGQADALAWNGEYPVSGSELFDSRKLTRKIEP